MRSSARGRWADFTARDCSTPVCELHFLLHSDYEHVRQHGLICESPDGDFTLPKVNAYADVRDMPKCDVVCVCLKTTQNHLLPQLLPAIVKDEGVALIMQNGLGMEAQVAEIVGAQRVIGGLCFLCSNKVGPGHIRHLGYTLVALGEFATRGASERLRSIADDFRRANVETELAEDLDIARWQKLVWNIPYNGLSVILDATTTELMANPQTRQLVETLMWEVVSDAQACGAAVPDNIVARMLSNTEKMAAYRTSMKIDYDERRPLEVEAIFGNPLRAVRKAGGKSPLLEELYALLKFLDARNAASRH